MLASKLDIFHIIRRPSGNHISLCNTKSFEKVYNLVEDTSKSFFFRFFQQKNIDQH